MPLLSNDAVVGTFYSPVAPAACLLVLLKCVAYSWTLSRLELGPSWVLVLRNALEITVEERPLALEMCLRGQDDRHETQLKNGSFSPQNGPPCGTTPWYMPYCTPFCHHLIAQSPWKNNGPHCKRPLDTPAIVLSFQDDRPESS